MKKELYDLVIQDLDASLGCVEDIAHQTQIRVELRGILISEEEITGCSHPVETGTPEHGR